MKIQTDGAAMNPATPKTEPPPLTQRRITASRQVVGGGIVWPGKSNSLPFISRIVRLVLTLGCFVAPARAADTVPEPRPAQTDYLVGAHYFPGWKEGTEKVHQGWANIVPFPDRTPLLGYYDEGNPEVADWEIKWALEHGIHYFVYCWYRNRNNLGRPVTERDLNLGHAIHEGLFHAKYASRFQFAIMWENNGAGVASSDDLFQNLLPFWMENYFKHPSYLKVDGKPVLYVYQPGKAVNDLGSVEKVRIVFEQMREFSRAQGFAGLLVLCNQGSTDPKVIARYRDCGYDAQFAYALNPHKDLRPSPQDVIAYQLDTIKAGNSGTLPFVPCASMGKDNMAWQDTRPNARAALKPETMFRWRLSPEQFQNLLQQIKTTVMDRAPSGSLERRMLLLDNWNEWGEGHFIAPHAGAGFGYLRAVREVFTRCDNRPDYRSPYELGLGPYDSRYRGGVKAPPPPQ
jgi:hypothetical protein